MKEIKINKKQETIYSFNAPTGLPVYMWPTTSKKNVHLSLVVKYGSTGTNFTCNNVKYSVPTGTAHYLEHLKFHLKNEDASNLFYDLGCDSNAYTSLKETCFEVYANENIYEATKLLLNFVYDNYFTKKLVDNERGIILEECNSNKDNPDYEFYREVISNYLVKSHYREPVIGYEKDIKEISIDDVSLIHNFFYRPENMFMVITGNFDIKEMEKTINENEKDRTFKDIGKIKIIPNKEPKGVTNKELVIENKKVVNTKGKYLIKTLENSFKGYKKPEILIALRSIIQSNFSRISDFYEDVIQNNIATNFNSSVSYDDGVYGVEFAFVSEEPEKMFELIKDKLNHIEFTSDDLNRIRKTQFASSIMRFDNIYSVSSLLVGEVIDEGKISDEKLDILNSITIKKVKDIFNKVDLSNTMTAILKPKKRTK